VAALTETPRATNALIPQPTTVLQPPTLQTTIILAPTLNVETITSASPTVVDTLDLATANPKLIESQVNLEAAGWTYTTPCFSSVCAVALGPTVGSFTADGNYVVVLVLVANNTGKDQPLPPDFFVLKDAEGRVYRPLPKVSSAYVQRGVNADIGMEDAVPANGLPTSLPLVFDVDRGATNLVVFASGKRDRGWRVFDNVP
jgi:hypothetical protein